MNPKPKTILIVDDDEGMRDTLNAILRRDYRVLRGSSWYHQIINTHSAYRYSTFPSNSNYNIGFRCALSAP